MTLLDAIEKRLAVPCTLSELAAILDAPLRSVQGHAYRLRREGRIERLDRTIKTSPGVGRRAYLWQRKYLQELV
jgi:hypothetical protein